MNPTPASRLAAALAAALPVLAAANPFDCLIEPNQTVEIRSATEGVIEKVLVQRGDHVRAGQLLVQLESAAEASTVELARQRAVATGRIASAQNRLDYAKKKLERNAQLEAQKFVSSQARDEADAEKRIAESDLHDALESRDQAVAAHRQAVDLLNRRMLRSPFNGVVMDRMLNPGDLAEAGTGRKAILRLVQVEPLRVEVVLPPAAHGRLQARSSAEVMPEGVPGRYTAAVKVIDSVFDTASGTFGVRLELPNAGGRIPAGIRCKVDFPALRGLPSKAAALSGAVYTK